MIEESVSGASAARCSLLGQRHILEVPHLGRSVAGQDDLRDVEPEGPRADAQLREVGVDGRNNARFFRRLTA